ncbi:F0F1 ATP synthase subunit delta [Pedobacter sp.]|nr:F0F1 ATP synthase subunit delta [Candidatus Saccharibacteria bacterium]
MISRRLLTRSIADRLTSGEKQRAVVQQLAAYIVQHRLHKQTAMILNDIEAELARRGTVVARVTSAISLTDDLRAQLIDYVKSATDASHITLDEHIDAALLGGVIIQTPDKMLDASIATRLKQLKTT